MNLQLDHFPIKKKKDTKIIIVHGFFKKYIFLFYFFKKMWRLNVIIIININDIYTFGPPQKINKK